MDRKLTENEVAFLKELRELMWKYNAMFSVEDGRVCIDIAYKRGNEPIVFPNDITASHDLDDVILANS